jgi:hypothetical protein
MNPIELYCKDCKALLGRVDDCLRIRRGGMEITIPVPPPVVFIVCYRCSLCNVFNLDAQTPSPPSTRKPS